MGGFVIKHEQKAKVNKKAISNKYWKENSIRSMYFLMLFETLLKKRRRKNHSDAMLYKIRLMKTQLFWFPHSKSMQWFAYHWLKLFSVSISWLCTHSTFKCWFSCFWSRLIHDQIEGRNQPVENKEKWTNRSLCCFRHFNAIQFYFSTIRLGAVSRK